ncbi:MAG: phasin family protein, partial [Pseudomonadota bacterium]
QAMAEDGVAKSREAYQRMNVAAQEQFKNAEQVLLATHAGTKAIGEKMMHNAAANTEAMFNAAQSIARAKTVPEATRLQADYIQQQTSAATVQAKEIFDLSAKVTKQALEAINAAAAKSFETMKKPE